MPMRRVVGVVFLLFNTTLLVGETRVPFPFSHKRHAEMEIECTFCHAAALTGPRAEFPAASKCMSCHSKTGNDAEALQKLAAAPEDARIVPQKPVYRLPDFVYFSHARHKTASASCETCHGNVWGSDAIKQKLSMRMKSCVDCHRENHATITCNTCHEPFQ